MAQDWFRAQRNNHELWGKLNWAVHTGTLWKELKEETYSLPLPASIRSLLLEAHTRLKDIRFISRYGLAVATSDISGKGVFALFRIARGHLFGGAYCGQLYPKQTIDFWEECKTHPSLSPQDLQWLQQTIRRKSVYFMELNVSSSSSSDKRQGTSSSYYIDPTDLDGVPYHPLWTENVLQFINTVKRPTDVCHAQFWNVLTDMKPDHSTRKALLQRFAPYYVTGRALQDIEPFTEILCAYGEHHDFDEDTTVEDSKRNSKETDVSLLPLSHLQHHDAYASEWNRRHLLWKWMHTPLHQTRRPSEKVVGMPIPALLFPSSSSLPRRSHPLHALWNTSTDILPHVEALGNTSAGLYLNRK